MTGGRRESFFDNPLLIRRSISFKHPTFAVPTVESKKPIYIHATNRRPHGNGERWTMPEWLIFRNFKSDCLYLGDWVEPSTSTLDVSRRRVHIAEKHGPFVCASALYLFRFVSFVSSTDAWINYRQYKADNEYDGDSMKTILKIMPFPKFIYHELKPEPTWKSHTGTFFKLRNIEWNTLSWKPKKRAWIRRNEDHAFWTVTEFFSGVATIWRLFKK